MTAPKLSKSEAIRKTIEHTREEAIANLQKPEDKEIYQKVLSGDEDAVRSSLRYSLGTPLYEACNYVYADFLDLQSTIKSIGAEDNSGFASLVAMGAPAAAAPTPTSANPLGIPGLNFPGLPSGLPAAAPAGAAPLPTPVVDISDFTELLDAWMQRYGSLSNYFERELIRTAVNASNKEVLKELMDRDIFTKESINIVKRQTSKSAAYIKNKEYDLVEVPFFQYLMVSNNTPMLELLVEHHHGREMWAASLDDLRYEVLQFCFDTHNESLFQGFLDMTPSVEGFVSKQGTPIICDYMYRCDDTESDMNNLTLLVDKGGSLTAKDPLHSNALMVAAKIGNLNGVQFALNYNAFDLHDVNLGGETVLSLAQEGPARRKEEQESYDEAVARATEKFKEDHEAWTVKAQVLEAAGKKAPPEPKEPQFKPRPEDYPVEIINLIENAMMLAGPPEEKPAETTVAEDIALDFEFSGSF